MDYHGFLTIFLTTFLFLNLTLAAKKCDFPAIFNLGDSNSDTGGLAASAFDIPSSPYGETYFHMPAGRFSDGRVIIDFIAEGFGLSYLSAYLDAIASNFTSGANFATASSTIVPVPNVFPLGGFSPFSLDIQLKQLMQLKSRSHIYNKKGGIFSDLLPKNDHFVKALYTFDIGQNDLGARIFSGNMTIHDVKASVPDIVNNFSTTVKKLYDEGGRSFWIHNTGPIGCLPYIFVNLPVSASQKDKTGCAKPYNEVAEYFNTKLREVVVKLRKELPLAAITYVDIYTVKYNLISQASKYGFEHPLVACCGYGGEYNYSSAAGCGATINVNGSQVFVGSCDKPSRRISWDGIHFTEAASRWIYQQIATGEFSDPPVPLKMACHI